MYLMPTFLSRFKGIKRELKRTIKKFIYWGLSGLPGIRRLSQTRLKMGSVATFSSRFKGFKREWKRKKMESIYWGLSGLKWIKRLKKVGGGLGRLSDGFRIKKKNLKFFSKIWLSPRFFLRPGKILSVGFFLSFFFLPFEIYGRGFSVPYKSYAPFYSEVPRFWQKISMWGEDEIE